jgi:hypothetical protein
MSRGFGKVERQILTILDADAGAHACFSLERLVYAVSGYITGLADDYIHPERRTPVCECKPLYLPGVRTPVYHHRDTCYPGPKPPTDAQVLAIHRAVRSLERKGVLKSVLVGQKRPDRWETWHPCRMKYLWQADTPINELRAWLHTQQHLRSRPAFFLLWES